MTGSGGGGGKINIDVLRNTGDNTGLANTRSLHINNNNRVARPCQARLQEY